MQARQALPRLLNETASAKGKLDTRKTSLDSRQATEWSDVWRHDRGRNLVEYTAQRRFLLSSKSVASVEMRMNGMAFRRANRRLVTSAIVYGNYSYLSP